MCNKADKPLLTFIVIAADDGTHEKEYMEVEDSIIAQPFNNKVRYIIYKYDTKNDKAVSKELQQDLVGNNYFAEINEPNASNMGFYSEEVLTGFLEAIDDIQKESEHRYIVLTWGHGAGLGFFTRIDDLPDRINEKFDWIPIKIDYKLLSQKMETLSFLNSNFSVNIDREFKTDFLLENIFSEGIPERIDKGVLYDVVTKDAQVGIPVSVFKTILQKSIKKVDILICVNCYAQMFETGFLLMDVVKVLVGSQTSIPFAGINYTKLFQLLNTFPTVDNFIIAENTTIYYYPKYYETPYYFRNDNNELKLFNIKNTCLSANNLERYDKVVGNVNKIVTLIERFAGDLNNLKEPILKIVKHIRNRCSDTTSYLDVNFIDLVTIFQGLIQNIADDVFTSVGNIPQRNDTVEQLITHFGMLYKSIDNAVISMATSRELYDLENLTNAKSLSPRFTSVFCPKRNQSTRSLNFLNAYLTNQEMSTFFKETNWNTLCSLLK